MSNNEKDNVENAESASLMNYNRTAYGYDFVHDNVTRYAKHFERGKEESEREANRKKRIQEVRDIADNFYTLITDFYEYGYGRSFHFAPVLSASSSLQECIVAYEREISKTIKAGPGMKLLVRESERLHCPIDEWFAWSQFLKKKKKLWNFPINENPKKLWLCACKYLRCLFT